VRNQDILWPQKKVCSFILKYYLGLALVFYLKNLFHELSVCHKLTYNEQGAGGGLCWYLSFSVTIRIQFSAASRKLSKPTYSARRILKRYPLVYRESFTMHANNKRNTDTPVVARSIRLVAVIPHSGKTPLQLPVFWHRYSRARDFSIYEVAHRLLGVQNEECGRQLDKEEFRIAETI